MAGSEQKKESTPVQAMLEDILGCKWSLRVLELVRQGVCRPGAMERSTQGLTAKVLNERLKKLTRYGILTRQDFAEIPPRVEYQFTTFGEKIASILAQIEALEAQRS